MIEVRINKILVPESEYVYNESAGTITFLNYSMIDISGPYLTENGWQRKGSTYTKGEDVITYDGCEWFLNGKRIFTTNDVP